MKKIIRTLLVCALVSLFITSIVYADLPGAGWWTSYTVQNVGGDSGSLQMTAYDASSSSTYGSSEAFTFDYGESLIYDPGRSPNHSSGGNVIGFGDQLPSGFEGSLVLSGSVPMLAAAQVANYTNGNVGVSYDSASGMYQSYAAADASTNLQFPIVKTNWAGNSTSFYIQAAGSDANVTVTFNMNDGSTYTVEDQFIEANKMRMFDPISAGAPTTDCGAMDFNVSPCFGAAEVTSDTPIAGVVIEHPFSGSPVGLIYVTRGLTNADASTVLFSPSIKNEYYGGVAGASIMNIGSEDAKVKLTLTVTLGPQAGNIYSDELIIPPNSTKTFSKWLDNLGGMPSGNFGAARIESVTEGEYTAQPLIGISNDTMRQSRTPGGKGGTAAYAYSIESATPTNGAPMVKEYYDIYTGGLTVVNVGSQPTTITFTYYEYGSDNVYTFWTKNTVQPNAAVNTGRISYNPNDVFENDGSWEFSEMRNKEFSVIAQASNDQSIVSLVTAYDPNTNKFYDVMNYEGFSFIP